MENTKGFPRGNPILSELVKLKEENAKLKQEVSDLSDIISMLKKGMERNANCPSCKAREPQLTPKR